MPPQRKSRARAPHQLPPGRHKLSRDYVEANQRERILDAVADVSSIAGYAAMTVEEIIGTAGVSRRTFYDTFAGKEEAFLAALDAVGAQLRDPMEEAYRSSTDFADGVRACLTTFLEMLAAEPRHADLLIVEVLAAGPAALERRNRMLARFADMLRTGAAKLPAGRRPPALTAETIIGGIYEVVYSRLLQGQAAELPALAPDLAYSILQPYVGHDEAQRRAPSPPAT